MSTQPRPLNTWDLLIAYQVERGLAADEIADVFDHMYAGAWEMFTDAGELLGWGSLYGRRRILKLIAAITGTPRSSASVAPRPIGPEWIATVRAYRQCLALHPNDRPTQLEVATSRNISEDTLARRLRKLGIVSWHDVQALVESEP